MLNRWLLAVVAGSLLVGVACGGDDDEDSGSDNQGEETQQSATATRKPDQVLPTPTPVADDQPAVLVVVPDKDPWQPTVAEFRELPTTDVDGSSGVSIRDLAEKAGATEDMIVNIDGYAPGDTRGFTVRYPLAEIADTTVLVVDENGHLSLRSSSLPQSELLEAVSSIAFAK